MPIPPTRRQSRRLATPLILAAAALVVLLPGTAAHADPTAAEIETQITAVSTTLEQTVEEFNRVTETLTATEAAAVRAAADIAPLATALDEATKRVNLLAARAYQGGGLVQLSALLSAGDPGAMVDRLVSIDQVSTAERGRISSYSAAKQRYDAEAATSAALVAEQTRQRAALDAQKKEIEGKLSHLYDLRRQAYGRAQSTGATYGGPPPAVAGAAGVAISFAYAAIGTPYVWAGASPNGYDCSGLTMAAWRAAGVSLPHNAAMQWNRLPHISRAALAPGDLVFYAGLAHVGIYVGNGQIIHAPTFGDHVRLASVDVMTPYGYARP